MVLLATFLFSILNLGSLFSVRHEWRWCHKHVGAQRRNEKTVGTTSKVQLRARKESFVVLYSLLPSWFVLVLQVGLKEVEDILRDVDLNGDGLVDFEGKTSFSDNLFKA